MRPLLSTICLAILATANAQPVGEPTFPTTRLAFVNFAMVQSRCFNNRERARSRPTSEAAFAKSREAKQVGTNIEAWEGAIARRDFAAVSEHELQQKIDDGKKLLEKLKVERDSLLAKSQEDWLIEHWQEIRDAVAAYARQHEIHIVLGYGEPTDEAIRDKSSNVIRKMEAIDKGSTVLLRAVGASDITEGVIEMVNKRYREKNRR